jgi:uncharacterized protein (DUF1015 family)
MIENEKAMKSFEVIKPFRGITYSPHFSEKMSDIICPPYDVIDEKMQEELLKRSEYLSKLEERCKKEGVKAKKFLKEGSAEILFRGYLPCPYSEREKIICLKNSRCRLYIPNCQAFQPFLQPFSSSLLCILLAFLLSFHLM